ncbi:50S ribosomal protein L14 [Candidatus Daviesbacteria bacterium]|nr:50S ribosomal protein L14 [Candidatus Daviesbacteria bacterium]
MLQHRSIANVADNTKAKKVMVINIPGKSRMRFAHLAQVITGVVKEADPDGVVKDGEIVKAVIVRTRKENRRRDGSYIRFDDNAVVIIDKDGSPKGSRILGPVAREVRDAGFVKIASMAEEVW